MVRGGGFDNGCCRRAGSEVTQQAVVQPHIICRALITDRPLLSP